MNRPAFVLRQLRYYASLGSPHRVYVGDSSDERHADELECGLASLGSRLNVKHLRLPRATDYGALVRLCETAVERYVAFIGDDDFLVPGSLTECAEFLDSAPDYASAHGLGVLMRVDSEQPYGEVVGASRYVQRPAEETSAAQRLLSYLSLYWTICFSVQRRDPYLAAAAQAAAAPDKTFRELIFNSLAIAGGKSKQIDRLFLIRQVHTSRYLLPDVYDWITSEGWQQSFQIYSRDVAAAVAARDALSAEAAADVVKEAFWCYLSAVLHDRYPARPQRAGHSRFRERARRIPLARALWRASGMMRATKTDPLSFSELLRPRSPYHLDFMAVYHAVLHHSSPLPDVDRRRVQPVHA